MLFTTLLGCGGGDGGLDGGGTDPDPIVPDPIVISLSISNELVTEQSPATITATVMQGTTAITSEVVTFTSTLSSFTPEAGTALTDSNGIASIVLNSGDIAGAGTVTATLASGEIATIGFTSDGSAVIDGPIIISLSISDELVTDQSPATITATVMQGTTAIASKVVTFVSTLGNFTPEAGTALTDSDGIATIVLNSGDVAGAGTVTATLASGETASIDFTTQGTSVTVVRIGSGEPFVEGIAAVSLEQISAGGTTVVSVSLVTESGDFFNESVDVNFSSVCAEEAVPSATIDSLITTSNGQASATYLAKGCVGDDPITVNSVVNGVNLSATGVVNVLPADVGSIEFVEATPEHIAIQGTGSTERPESATIIFRVLDTNGNPVNNQNVNFSLSSTGGDIVLNPIQATTNNEGLVQTVVNSGAVARTIRVIAEVDGSDPVVQTQSSELKISTGIPDQDSMSVSASVLNPEGWDIDGTEVEITARLADAFNNPPPPTTVYFTTEGGSIETIGASCITDVTGACSVTWRSQNPKPEGHVLSHYTGDEYNWASISPDVIHAPEINNTLGQKLGGRATILATTIGEESFPDLNGNGRFDVCEVPAFTGGVGKPCNADGSFDESGADVTYSGNDVGGNPYDLPEAFVDNNEDGVFNPSDAGGEAGGELEEPVDFNQNGIYDPKDGQYNGVLCAIPSHSGCAEETSIDVRDSIVLVMSGSNPQFVTTQPAGGADLIIFGESTANASVIISDLHNQQMPAGSEVEFSVAGFGSVVSETTYIWPNSNKNGGSGYSVTVKGEKEDLPKSGTLWVKVTTPSGVATSYPVANILIQ